MFELPEQDKMRICEGHREMGNMFYAEGDGFLPKAAEQYQLVLANINPSILSTILKYRLASVRPCHIMSIVFQMTLRNKVC